MKRNRIISLLLALVMAVLPVTVWAEGASSKKVPEYVAELLEVLDIMSAAEAQFDREIERGYAAEIIFRLLGGEEGTASGTVYSDVSADTSYGYAIERTTELGYFIGNGDGTFNPDGKISLSSMARLLLQFAGYGVATDQSDVVSEVYKNTSHYGNTTYKDLAHMIFNVLNMDAIYIRTVSDKDKQYYTSDDHTVMSALFDVYEVKGTIIENGLTGLWSGSSLAEDELCLSTRDGNIIIKAGETDIAKNIGRAVKIYVKHNTEYDEFTALVYYFTSNEDVEVINLVDFDLSLSTDNVLTYQDNGKTGKIKYNSETAIIYNGTYYSDAGFDIRSLDGLEGEVIVIDNDSDSYADVLDITAYKTYVVKSVSLTESLIYSKNTQEVLSLDSEDYDSYSISNVSGTKVYLEDFVPGMILSVAKNADSANKQVIKVYVSDEYVQGNISNIIDEDGRRYITVDGEAYYVLPSVTALPSGGKQVYGILSAFGNIAYFDTAKATGNAYGLIARITDEDDRTQIKIIDVEGSFIVLPVADTVKIDGEKFVVQEDIREKLMSIPATKIAGVSLPDGCYPIAYKLNSEGLVVDIDTPIAGSREGTDRLTRIATVNGDSGVMRSDLVLGGEIPVTADTPMIRVDAPVNSNNKIEKQYMTDSEFFTVLNMGEFGTPKAFNYAAFTTDPKSKFPHFLIGHYDASGGGGTEDDFMFVVDDMKQSWDEATQQVLTKVIGYQKGVEKEFYISPDYQADFDALNLHRGDILRFSTGAYGHISGIEKGRPTVYQDFDGADTDGMDIRNINKSGYDLQGDFINGYDNLMLLYGYVLEREGDLITIGFKPVGDFNQNPNGTRIEGTRTLQDLEGDEVLMRIPSGVVITVYDSEKDEIIPATYDEIKSYDTVGKDCSFVLVRYRSHKMAEIVVYNNSSLFR